MVWSVESVGVSGICRGLLPFLGQLYQAHVSEAEVDEILQQLFSDLVLDGLSSLGEQRVITTDQPPVLLLLLSQTGPNWLITAHRHT